MLREFQTATLIAATLTTGLSAGLYYGFACAVMPGLARTEDRSFIQGMRRINTAILNGWFMLLFLGSLLFTIAAAALQLPDAGWGTALPWTVAALVLYVAVLVVTMSVNVPLNNALEAGDPPDASAELTALRARFESPWTRWNLIRTVLNAAAFACLAWALMRQR
ncbi:MAG: DUF1772 domain-containing protein [Streptomyces sp.]|uniref:anthrone oxygenase family protein n=1 Tax=Streptomyces sp. TaxID=1931 RepID=UPI003D6C2014